MAESISYLSYRVGEELFATHARFVDNIIEYTRITAIPKSPEYILGVINIRDRVLPVVDARIALGIENREITSNTCILVMEIELLGKQVFFGFLVDAVAEVIEIHEDEIKSAPFLSLERLEDFIEGFYHHKDQYLMIMDMNRLFAEDDMVEFSTLDEVA